MRSLITIALTFLTLVGIAQSTVSTYPTLTANNGTSGVTFQASTTAAIDVISMQVTITTGIHGVNVWYRPGGVLHPSATTPNVSTANGWILHEVVNITSTSTTIPSTLVFTTPLNLQPGITYGFAVGGTNQTRYMTYSAALPSSFTDGTLSITTGPGSGFGGALPTPTIATRSFVGSMTYLPVSTLPNDVGVLSIDSPAGGCEGDYNVVVTVKNFGVNQVDTVSVNWSVNGNLQTPVDYYQLLDTFNGNFSQSATITLGTVTLTGGLSDTIIAWTSMPNNLVDSNSSNDSSVSAYNSLSTISSFPYVEDFENGQGEWFTGGNSSSWAFGTPAKVTITGASSGLNAFVTGGLGTGQYNAGENSWVASPCFDMTSFQGTPWVALDIWYNSEFSWDGAVLQSSADGGNSWINVGAYLDPNNWYTDNSVSGNPGGQQVAWSGRGTSGSGGWIMAKHPLDVSLLNGPVQFRIAFGADGSINDDGFAFDDVRIVDFREADLGPDVVSLCGEPSITLDPGIPLNGKILWSTMDSVSATIQVNSPDTIWVSYTDTLIDESTYDEVIIIQTPAPQINFASNIDTVAVQSSITLDPNLPYDLDYVWSPGGFTFPYLLVKGSDYGLGTHSFNLKVTDSVLCEDEQLVVVVFLDFTGESELDGSSVTLYPNPVHSTLILNVQNVASEKLEVTIYDLQGKLLNFQTYGLNGSSNIEIDFSSYTSGNYILKAVSGDKVFVRQLVKN